LAWAPPQTPLGELTALPRPASCIKRALLIRGREGRGEEKGRRKEGVGEEGEDEGKGGRELPRAPRMLGPALHKYIYQSQQSASQTHMQLILWTQKIYTYMLPSISIYRKNNGNDVPIV